MAEEIAVIGAGSYGTCLAMLMAVDGHDVTLWCRNPDLAERMTRTRENDAYLPGYPLPAAVQDVSLWHVDDCGEHARSILFTGASKGLTLNPDGTLAAVVADEWVHFISLEPTGTRLDYDSSYQLPGEATGTFEFARTDDGSLVFRIIVESWDGGLRVHTLIPGQPANPDAPRPAWLDPSPEDMSAHWRELLQLKLDASGEPVSL